MSLVQRALVLKMLQVIRAGRWEYDRSERDLVRRFNAVQSCYARRVSSYETDRSRGVAMVMAGNHAFDY